MISKGKTTTGRKLIFNPLSIFILSSPIPTIAHTQPRCELRNTHFHFWFLPMIVGACSACRQIRIVPFICLDCSTITCIQCTVQLVLKSTYPAQIIQRCPFCQATLTRNIRRAIYKANLSYASFQHSRRQPVFTIHKKTSSNPYI